VGISTLATIVTVVIIVAAVGFVVFLPRTVYCGSACVTPNTTFTTDLYYPITINYSGSWNLSYWGQNGTYGLKEKTIPGTTWQYDVKGNLNGSGNYVTTIVTYGVGYMEDTLCANATKLNSQSNLTLTLTVLGQSNSTTALNPSAEVCATYATA